MLDLKILLVYLPEKGERHYRFVINNQVLRSELKGNLLNTMPVHIFILSFGGKHSLKRHAFRHFEPPIPLIGFNIALRYMTAISTVSFGPEFKYKGKDAARSAISSHLSGLWHQGYEVP